MRCKFSKHQDIQDCTKEMNKKCTWYNSKDWLYLSDVDNKIRCERIHDQKKD